MPITYDPTAGGYEVHLPNQEWIGIYDTEALAERALASRNLLDKLEELRIPMDMATALVRYAIDRTPVGGFLTAVLENDLKGAAARADGTNKALLVNYAQAMMWAMPSQCQGSPEKVDRWIAGGRPNVDQEA